VPQPDRSLGGRALPASQIRSPWLLALAAIISTLPLVHLAMPPTLALPAISLLLVLAGFVIGAYAYWTGRTPEVHRLGPKDVAGALVLLGFAAALLSDTELALTALDEWRAALAASAPM
jgi:hypothetical protein